MVHDSDDDVRTAAGVVPGDDAQTFREFLERQDIFVFFITIYVGPGLIANDRRANALQIYLSKPLTRLEYIAGKAAILLAFLLGVTWLPAVLLLAVQTMFAGNFGLHHAPTRSCCRRSPSTRSAGRAGDITMLALSSLVEEREVRRRSCTPASSSSPIPCSAC